MAKDSQLFEFHKVKSGSTYLVIIVSVFYVTTNFPLHKLPYWLMSSVSFSQGLSRSKLDKLYIQARTLSPLSGSSLGFSTLEKKYQPKKRNRIFLKSAVVVQSVISRNRLLTSLVQINYENLTNKNHQLNITLDYPGLKL